jgi:hypothetical protein
MQTATARDNRFCMREGKSYQLGLVLARAVLAHATSFGDRCLKPF